MDNRLLLSKLYFNNCGIFLFYKMIAVQNVVAIVIRMKLKRNWIFIKCEWWWNIMSVRSQSFWASRKLHSYVNSIYDNMSYLPSLLLYINMVFHNCKPSGSSSRAGTLSADESEYRRCANEFQSVLHKPIRIHYVRNSYLILNNINSCFCVSTVTLIFKIQVSPENDPFVTEVLQSKPFSLYAMFSQDTAWVIPMCRS